MAELEKVNAIFTADMRSILDGLDKVALRAGQATERVAKKFDDLGKKLNVAGRRLSKVATLPILGLATVAVRAADEQIQAENRLAAAIRFTGEEVGGQLATFKEFASTIQTITTVGDEASLANIQVARSMGLSARASARAAKNAVGLAKAFGINERSAIRYTAALEQGDTTMLNRYIPSLRLVEDDTERVALAQKILGDAFGIAIAEAEQGLGPFRQLKNDIGDLAEQFGVLILEAVNPFIKRARAVVASLQAMSPEAKRSALAIAGIAAAVGPGLIALGTLTRAIGFVISGLNILALGVLRTAKLVARGMAAIVGSLLTLPGAVAAVAAAAIVFRKTLFALFDGIGRVLERKFVNEVKRPLLTSLSLLKQDVPDSIQRLLGIEDLEFEVPPAIPEAGNTLKDAFLDAAKASGEDVRVFKEQLSSLFDAAVSKLPPGLREVFDTFSLGFEGVETGAEDASASIDALIAKLSDAGAGAEGAASTLITEFEKLKEAVRTPEEEFVDTLQKLEELREGLAAVGVAGEEVEEVFRRARAQATDQVLELQEEVEMTASAWRDFGADATTGFAEAILAGEELSEILGALQRDLANFALRQLVLAPLTSAFTGALPAAKGMAVSGGVRAFARGGVVDRPTLFPMANGAGLMGERGAEAVLPLHRTRGGELGVKAVTGGGSGPRVVVNVTAPPGSTVSQNRRRRGPDLEEINILIDRATADAIERPGSQTHRAMRRTFGAQVQTTER